MSRVIINTQKKEKKMSFIFNRNALDMRKYWILAEVARKKNLKKNVEKIFWNKKLDFFSLWHPVAPLECPQKISAWSVQPFGRL